MLLNEFLKEHRKVEEQQAAITELKAVAAAATEGVPGGHCRATEAIRGAPETAGRKNSKDQYTARAKQFDNTNGQRTIERPEFSTNDDAAAIRSMPLIRAGDVPVTIDQASIGDGIDKMRAALL